MISIKIIAFFLKIWEKVMLVVTMATDVAIKILIIIFLVLSGNDHSVKVSSNSEVGSGTALWEFFGFLRELVLITTPDFPLYYYMLVHIWDYFCMHIQSEVTHPA